MGRNKINKKRIRKEGNRSGKGRREREREREMRKLENKRKN
jgi:hypothetical protein